MPCTWRIGVGIKWDKFGNTFSAECLLNYFQYCWRQEKAMEKDLYNLGMCI